MRNFSIFLAVVIILGFSLGGCVPPPKVSSYPKPGTAPLPKKSVPPTMPKEPEAKAVEKPETGPKPAAPAPTPVAPMVEPLDKLNQPYIQERLAVYEKKFEQRRQQRQVETGQSVDRLDHAGWDECLTKADRLVSGYSRLRDLLGQEGQAAIAADARRTFADLLKQDIAYLEGNCEKPPAALSPAPHGEAAPTVAQKTAQTRAEADIDQYFQAGQYQKVIDAFQGFTAAHPEAQPSLTTARQYARSLLHEGENVVAAAFFNTLQPRLEVSDQAVVPWELQRLAADLQFASGNQTAARSLYDRLVSASEPVEAEINWASMQLALLTASGNNAALDEYRILLRDYLAFDQRGQGGSILLRKAEALSAAYPRSKVAESAKQIRETVEKALWARTDQGIARARELSGEKQYQQAAALLKELLATDLPDEMKDHVQRNLEQVLAAEERELAIQKSQADNALATQMTTAKNLLDSQRYDEAIAAYQGLQNTEHAGEARRKMAEATEQAAAARRQEAAALFIKAMKTEDKDRKKDLLLNSRQILKDILLKYPGIDLTGKVNQNLKAVEEQLMAIDPQVLEEHSGGQTPGTAGVNEAAKY